jgi:hypothetical protein
MRNLRLACCTLILAATFSMPASASPWLGMTLPLVFGQEPPRTETCGWWTGWQRLCESFRQRYLSLPAR